MPDLTFYLFSSLLKKATACRGKGFPFSDVGFFSEVIA